MPVTRSQKASSLGGHAVPHPDPPSQRNRSDRVSSRTRSADDSGSANDDVVIFAEDERRRVTRSRLGTANVAAQAQSKRTTTTAAAAASNEQTLSLPPARMTRPQRQTSSTLSTADEAAASTIGTKRSTQSTGCSSSSVASLPGKTSQVASKKARFSKEDASLQLPAATRTYNLRSQQHTSPDDATMAAEDSKPLAVTPGTVTRQINFAPSPQANDNGGLPEGVVDIFAKAVKPHSKSVCSCIPYAANLGQTLQILASQHLTDYGIDYCEEIKKREQRGCHELSANLKLAKTDDAADDDSSKWQQENSKSGDDDDDSVPSTTTTVAATAAQRTKSLWSRSTTSSSETSVDSSEFWLNISDTEPLPRQPFLTPKMRRVLVHWLSEVAVEYKLSDATLHFAVTLLDTILTMGPTKAHVLRAEELVSDDEDEDERFFTIRRTDFQAVGCACIWIASKIEDRSPPRVDDLVYISDYSFSSDKLRGLETRICNLLNFRLQRVTPFHFLQVTLRASQACPLANCHHYLDNAVLLNMTLYLLELSRSSFILSSAKPSLLTAACVFLARATLGLRAQKPQAVDEHGIWTKTLEFYTGYSVDDLTGTVLQIHGLQVRAEKSDNGVTPAFVKYKKAQYFFVSLKTVIRVEDLGLATEMEHDDLAIDLEDHSVLS